MYAYIRKRTRTSHLKKGHKGLEPAIFCILLVEATPALRGYAPQCRYQNRDKLRHILYVGVARLVIAPGCYWQVYCAGPAVPPPPAMTSPAQAWTWISRKPSCAPKQGLERAMCRRTEARFRKRPWLDSCPVLVDLAAVLFDWQLTVTWFKPGRLKLKQFRKSWRDSWTHRMRPSHLTGKASSLFLSVKRDSYVDFRLL